MYDKQSLQFMYHDIVSDQQFNQDWSSGVSVSDTQVTQNVCIIFVQCRTNVEDVRSTLYKCYTNALCLLGTYVYVYIHVPLYEWYIHVHLYVYEYKFIFKIFTCYCYILL